MIEMKIEIPFLVTSQPIDLPNLGYNVIEECIKMAGRETADPADSLQTVFSNLDIGARRTLVDLIQDIVHKTDNLGCV